MSSLLQCPQVCICSLFQNFVLFTYHCAGIILIYFQCLAVSLTGQVFLTCSCPSRASQLQLALCISQFFIAMFCQTKFPSIPGLLRDIFFINHKQKLKFIKHFSCSCTVLFLKIPYFPNDELDAFYTSCLIFSSVWQSKCYYFHLVNEKNQKLRKAKQLANIFGYSGEELRFKLRFLWPLHSLIH